MCDTLISLGPTEALFAKNSDREALEAQAVERHPPAEHPDGAEVRCTWISVPQVRRTHGVVISRPAWMWGAEMGVNDRGVAIGNEAVFTREPVADVGLTGMDLVRLALERSGSAAEALEVIADLLARFPQGGGMGFSDKGFRYHGSFILADRAEAWVLETAGRFWAARRVREHATISNVLSIGADFDRIHPEAAAHAVARGWARGAAAFAFADAFGAPLYRLASGGAPRAACTLRLLEDPGADAPGSPESLMAALRDHDGHHPADGWRMTMPCAHASWLPTRHAGQTTGSLVARLGETAEVWATGGSAPCLGVFKPVPVAGPRAAFGGVPGEAPDPDSLWWRQERLHREVMQAYEPRRAAFEEARRRLQGEALAADPSDEAAARDLWERHRAQLPEWTERARAAAPGERGLFQRYWRRQGAIGRSSA